MSPIFLSLSVILTINFSYATLLDSQLPAILVSAAFAKMPWIPISLYFACSNCFVLRTYKFREVPYLSLNHPQPFYTTHLSTYQACFFNCLQLFPLCFFPKKEGKLKVIQNLQLFLGFAIFLLRKFLKMLNILNVHGNWMSNPYCINIFKFFQFCKKKLKEKINYSGVLKKILQLKLKQTGNK